MTNKWEKTVLVSVLTLTGFAIALADADNGADEALHAPIEHVTLETALNTVKLTKETAGHLGIQSAPVEIQEVRRRRLYGGNVTIAPNHQASLTAPIAGTVEYVNVANSRQPAAGVGVKKGEPLLHIMPLQDTEASALSATERSQLALSYINLTKMKVDMDARVQSAQVEVQAAETAAQRAEQMLRDKVGSQRAVDEATSRLVLARKTLEAAHTERDALERKVQENLEKVHPLVLLSPIDGTISATNAVTGQIVSPGTVLVDVVNLDTVWVKVAVIQSELPSLDITSDIEVSPLGSSGVASMRGSPVAGLTTADPLSITVDLYYEVHAPHMQFRPNQRVQVVIPLKESDARLTVPFEAILHDIYGGQWVYVETAALQYTRARVEVQYVSDGRAVLTRGPSAGTPVITDGAAELFGAEFGNDK